MRIQHRVPVRDPQSAVLDPAYQAEVDRATRKAERAYAAAVSALARAEAKLLRVEQTRNRKAIALAAEIVELRRAQLAEIERMMQASPAPATHRGVDSFRPVPVSGRRRG